MSGDHDTAGDQALLRETLAGDERAFVEVYRRYHDRVFRFAYRMTGSPETARDVTHTCFVGLLEAPGRYDAERAGLGTYLCAAARNLSLRHASRAWRERAVASDAGAASTARRRARSRRCSRTSGPAWCEPRYRRSRRFIARC